MKITLEIQDDRYKAFLEFIRTLDYVSIKKEEHSPTSGSQQ
ncbi:hypothetical protein [Negadavirga shengliensis]|uniref:Uncharacterized protein n=1 Tax=Negadavirga shengliensis TaxID=1389218 RepID=A0ABV9SW00_9BACT